MRLNWELLNDWSITVLHELVQHFIQKISFMQLNSHFYLPKKILNFKFYRDINLPSDTIQTSPFVQYYIKWCPYSKGKSKTWPENKQKNSGQKKANMSRSAYSFSTQKKIYRYICIHIKSPAFQLQTFFSLIKKLSCQHIPIKHNKKIWNHRQLT